MDRRAIPDRPHLDGLVPVSPLTLVESHGTIHFDERFTKCFS